VRFDGESWAISWNRRSMNLDAATRSINVAASALCEPAATPHTSCRIGHLVPTRSPEQLQISDRCPQARPSVRHIRDPVFLPTNPVLALSPLIILRTFCASALVTWCVRRLKKPSGTAAITKMAIINFGFMRPPYRQFEKSYPRKTLRRLDRGPIMFALGHKRTLRQVNAMSALPQKRPLAGGRIVG
jgi:hypothetical protein